MAKPSERALFEGLSLFRDEAFRIGLQAEYPDEIIDEDAFATIAAVEAYVASAKRSEVVVDGGQNTIHATRDAILKLHKYDPRNNA